MYDSMRTSTWNSLWFIAVYLIGSRVILNLFISVLLDKFALAPDRLVIIADTRDVALLEDADSAAEDSEDSADEVGDEEEAKPLMEISQEEDKGADGQPGEDDELDVDIDFRTKQVEVIAEEELRAVKRRITLRDAHLVVSGTVVRVEPYDRERILREETLDLFSPTSSIRKFCFWLCDSQKFEWAIALVIVVNCIFLAVEPSIPPSTFKDVLQYVDIAFVCIYTVELAVNVISFGLTQTKDAYLRSGWNILDAGVILLSLLGLIFRDLASIKAFRSIRILRLLSRIDRLRITTTALLQTVPRVGSTFVLVVLLWVIWAIIGVNFFGGLFFRCNDPSIVARDLCTGTFFPDGSAVFANRTWYKPPYDFDNVGRSLLSLFQIANGVAAVGTFPCM
jgi:hypothetical protein